MERRRRIHPAAVVSVIPDTTEYRFKKTDVGSAFGMADHLALMAEGQIVAEGPPDVFRESQHPAVKALLRNWLARRSKNRTPAPGSSGAS